jgi:hypothetical protein
MIRLLGLGLLALCASACSSKDEGGGGASDSECTSLRPAGPRVALAQHTGAPEPAAGGAITDGRYELGGVVLYSPSGLVLTRCEEFTGALELSNGVLETALRCFWVAGDADSPSDGVLNAGDYRTSGTEVTFDYSCPDGLSEAFQYSADSSGLHLFLESGDGVVIEYAWLLQ